MLRVMVLLTAGILVIATACRLAYDVAVFDSSHPGAARAVATLTAVCTVVVAAAGIAVRAVLFEAVDPSTGKRRDHHGDAAPLGDGDQTAQTLLDDADFLRLSVNANNVVIANVDALNSAATALLALPVAFAVISSDKIRELCGPWNVLTVASLTGSLVIGFVAYEWGYRFGRAGWRVRDSTEPAQLLGAYARFGDRAVTEAVRVNNAVLERNVLVRQQKRTWIAWTMLLFMLGAGAFVEGRSTCPMVEAHHDRSEGLRSYVRSGKVIDLRHAG